MISSLVVLLAWSAPASATAPVPDGACAAGFSTQRFHPGLTLQDQQVNVQQDAVLTACTAPENPQIHSGTYRFVGSGTASCLTSDVSGELEFKWYEEAQPGVGPVIGTSTVELGTAVVLRPLGQNVAAATGTVTGGNTFVGDHLTYSEVLISGIDAVKCLTTGVTEQRGISAGIVFVG